MLQPKFHIREWVRIKEIVLPADHDIQIDQVYYNLSVCITKVRYEVDVDDVASGPQFLYSVCGRGFSVYTTYESELSLDYLQMIKQMTTV